MGLYTELTRTWLERRFKMTDHQSGAHFAHQPIYGVGHAACEPGHAARLARDFQVLRLLDGLEFDSLLDVGGAEGYLAWLVRRIFGVTAASCDLAVAAGQRARELFDVPAAAVDAANLPFADGAFDLVVCCEVLEHVEHPVATLLELSRVSGQGVIVTTEELHHDRAAIDAYLFARPGWPHMERNQFHPDDLRAALGPDVELLPQCRTAPPQLADRAAMRRFLLADACGGELGARSHGVIAAALGRAVRRPRRLDDEQLCDLLLASSVAPGRRPRAAGPVPADLLAKLVCPRTGAPLHQVGDELRAAGTGARYQAPDGVPDLTEVPVALAERPALAIALARRFAGSPARQAELLALHDRLCLPPAPAHGDFDYTRAEARRGTFANDQLSPIPGPAFAFRSTGADPWFSTPLLDRPVGAVELTMRIHNPAFPEDAGTGQVFWTDRNDQTFLEAHSVRFPVKNDGAVHTYRVPLGDGAPTHIGWLRIDPVDGPAEIELLRLRLS
jgi:SAM-dependent methyltransferase